MADLKTLRRALVAIINGDAQLQTLMGRSTRLVRTWEDSGLVDELPVIAYQLQPFEETGENGDSWAGWITLSVFGKGDDALALCEDIKGRLLSLLSYPAFAAQGLDGASIVMRQLGDITGEDRQEASGLTRQDLEVQLRLFYP